jgi:hypothetical protein
MKRTLEDIRENLDHVGCDNETAREMCDEIERLHARADATALAFSRCDDANEHEVAQLKAEVTRLTSYRDGLDKTVRELEAQVAEWTQAAGVEAGLRREFLARAERAEAALTLIAGFGGKCLFSNTRGSDGDQAYREGSHAAWEDAAHIANTALING